MLTEYTQKVGEKVQIQVVVLTTVVSAFYQLSCIKTAFGR